MQGQLFTQEFLNRGIRETPPYEALTDQLLAAFRSALIDIHAGLSASSTINEAQTEQLVIDKVLVQLGWGDDHLPQVNASGKARTRYMARLGAFEDRHPWCSVRGNAKPSARLRR